MLLARRRTATIYCRIAAMQHIMPSSKYAGALRLATAAHDRKPLIAQAWTASRRASDTPFAYHYARALMDTRDWAGAEAMMIAALAAAASAATKAAVSTSLKTPSCQYAWRYACLCVIVAPGCHLPADEDDDYDAARRRPASISTRHQHTSAAGERAWRIGIELAQISIPDLPGFR